MSLRIGLSAQFEVEVGPTDTATAVGSGDLEVLGTPRVVALVEQATVRAVSGHLLPGQTTVGTDIALRHRRASLPGAHVLVAAELVEVDGSRLGFRVSAHEQGVLVADGTVHRAVVDSERFMRRAGL